MRIDKFKLAMWFCHILAWVNMIFFRFMLCIARLFLMLPERILSIMSRKPNNGVNIIDVLNADGKSIKQKFLWIMKLFWEETEKANNDREQKELSINDDGEQKEPGDGADADELDKMMKLVNKNIDGRGIGLHGINAQLLFDLLSTSTIIIIYILADVRRQKIIEKNGHKFISNGRELIFNMINFD